MPAKNTSKKQSDLYREVVWEKLQQSARMGLLSLACHLFLAILMLRGMVDSGFHHDWVWLACYFATLVVVSWRGGAEVVRFQEKLPRQ
jgi:hypothetical protein